MQSAIQYRPKVGHRRSKSGTGRRRLKILLSLIAQWVTIHVDKKRVIKGWQGFLLQ